jgi:LuxR family transcriptional regulator, maltose regulon positive regulatory protein
MVHQWDCRQSRAEPRTGDGVAQDPSPSHAVRPLPLPFAARSIAVPPVGAVSPGENMMTTSIAPTPIPIRRRKLLPPRLDGQVVARPRLMARLDESVRVPLTCIVAPAGFGKTTLVAQWLASIATPAAWLTLDAGDEDAARFVAHFVTAFAAITSLVPNQVLDLLYAPDSVSFADIGAALADALFDSSEDVIVVLDDAQTATSADVLSFLAQFLALLPPTVHLLIVSRVDLPLTIARLRTQGQVNDLRAADLRFTDEEVPALVTALGSIDATRATVDLLQEQMEGWVTGLRLAAGAMTLLRDPTEVTAAAEDRQHVMQFLVEEVLARQEAEVQEFLVQTSIVARICTDLADALLDQPFLSSQTILDRLAHENLFLEPDGDDPDWFRFHPVFQELLRHQLALRKSPEEIADLHARASRWYAREELIDEALSHLLATEDFTAAAELVEHHLHLALNREDGQSVARWLRALPEALISGRPELLLARGWVSHLSGRAAPLRVTLAQAEALLAQIGADPARVEALRGEIGALSLGTLLPIEQDPVGALRVAEHAVQHVPAERGLPFGLARGYVSLAEHALGRSREAVRDLEAIAEREAEHFDAGSIRALLTLTFLHRQAARYGDCGEVARHMLTLAERHDLAISAGWAHLFLGWLAYERDDLNVANTHFSAIATSYRRLHVSCVREGLFGTALVRQARGQTAAADATVQRLTEILIDTTALEHLPVVHGFEARLALLRQQPAVAMRWLETTDVGINSNTLHAFEHALLTKANTLLAHGTPDSLLGAAADLELLRARAETAHHTARLVEIWALTALVLDAQGRTDAALDAMKRSLALASGEAFFRTYADLGPAITPLLRRAAADVEIPPLLARLLERDVKDMDSAVNGVVPKRDHALSVLTLLTLRESDVLDGLGRRLSYQEIADELFISSGTVKRHVGSIYSKLGVANRRQAVLKAESLGWHPAV